MALGEMFPEPVRNGAGAVFSFTSYGVKSKSLFHNPDPNHLYFTIEPTFVDLIIDHCLIDSLCTDLYGFSRTYSWIFFSSAAVLFAPAIIQSGLIDIEEMAKAQQRQMLLGTNPAAYPR